MTDLDTVAERYDAVHRRPAGRRRALRDEVQPVRRRCCARSPRTARASRSPRWASCACCRSIGVDPAEVLYSNPIKPPAHIAEAFKAGLWRFSFDSEGELHKLAEHAPGSAVYIRLRVDDSTSIFPLSRKFGAEADEARALMLLARELGLRPYGVTFHVGSQCGTTMAWRQAIAIGRPADERAARRRHPAGDARPRRRVPGPLRRARAVAVQTSAEAIDQGLDELPAVSAGRPRRRARPPPGRRECGHGRQRARPRGPRPARTGCTSTSAPTTA